MRNLLLTNNAKYYSFHIKKKYYFVILTQLLVLKLKLYLNTPCGTCLPFPFLVRLQQSEKNILLANRKKISQAYDIKILQMLSMTYSSILKYI